MDYRPGVLYGPNALLWPDARIANPAPAQPVDPRAPVDPWGPQPAEPTDQRPVDPWTGPPPPWNPDQRPAPPSPPQPPGVVPPQDGASFMYPWGTDDAIPPWMMPTGDGRPGVPEGPQPPIPISGPGGAVTPINPAQYPGWMAAGTPSYFSRYKKRGAAPGGATQIPPNLLPPGMAPGGGASDFAGGTGGVPQGPQDDGSPSSGDYLPKPPGSLWGPKPGQRV